MPHVHLKSLKYFPGILGGLLVLSTCCFADQMTDKRDGQKYRTVKLGKQTWMAQNLNFKAAGSKCNEEKGCAALGRFYRWEEAKKVCPDGWHLPVKGELDAILKLGPRTLQDESGFALRLVGSFGGQDDVVYNEDDSYLWSSTEVNECDGEGEMGCLYTYTLRNSHFGISVGEEHFDADVLYSVRCVKD